MDHTEEQVLKAADFLKALANPNRLMILCLLLDKEFAVSELEERLDLRQPTLSQQLARLREDELVTTRREGKQIYYRLASDKVRRTIALLDDMFCSGALAAGELEERRNRLLEDAD
ncbi:MAG: metalloregulator ArsR/SmtB family transcription factor [Alphaproteobacteria bacterium]